MNDHILVSDSLQGQVADVDPTEEFKNNLLIAVLSVLKSDKGVETLVGSVASSLLDEHHELEIKVEMQEGFNFYRTWPHIVLAGYEIHRAEEIVSFKGPLRVSAVRIQEIDPARQTCVLAMKLAKE